MPKNVYFLERRL